MPVHGCTFTSFTLSSWDTSPDPHSKGLQFNLRSDMCVYFPGQTLNSSPVQSRTYKYCPIFYITFYCELLSNIFHTVLILFLITDEWMIVFDNPVYGCFITERCICLSSVVLAS